MIDWGRSLTLCLCLLVVVELKLMRERAHDYFESHTLAPTLSLSSGRVYNHIVFERPARDEIRAPTPEMEQKLRIWLAGAGTAKPCRLGLARALTGE